MNGPYRFIGSTSGRVSAFNTARSIISGIALSIAGSKSLIISISLGIAASIYNERYEGITYKASTYASGRRAKIVIQTYRDDRMKVSYKRYEEIKKW